MSMSPNNHRPKRLRRHRQLLEWLGPETGSVGPVPVWERRGQDMGSVELGQVSVELEQVSVQLEHVWVPVGLDMGSVGLGQVSDAREIVLGQLVVASVELEQVSGAREMVWEPLGQACAR